MDFDSFIKQAWADHADDAAGVALRLEQDGPARVSQAGQVAQLVQLVHHVHGEHLARWQDGLALLARIAVLPVHDAAGEGGAALHRCVASFRLCSGDDSVLAGLSPADDVRVRAMAAANLGGHDSERAAQLLRQAQTGAEAAALPDTDPAIRTIAVTGWNMACTLEEKSPRSDTETALMIEAAQASSRFWARAGGWLEKERGEYRLAMTWLQAGDARRAARHAQACLDIVAVNDGPALERFFGWEASGRVARALDDGAGHARAVAEAEAAFGLLEEDDRGWCRPSLDGLRVPVPGAA